MGIKSLVDNQKFKDWMCIIGFIIAAAFIIAIVIIVFAKMPSCSSNNENEENKFEYKERELVYYKDETGKQCCYTNTGKYSCLSGHDISVRMYYPDPNSPDKKKLIVTKDFYLIREVYKVKKDE